MAVSQSKWPRTYEFLADLHLEMSCIWSGKFTSVEEDTLRQLGLSIWTSNATPPWKPKWGEVVDSTMLRCAHMLLMPQSIVPNYGTGAIADVALKSEHMKRVRSLLEAIEEDNFDGFMDASIAEGEYEDELPGNPYVYPGHEKADLLATLDVIERHILRLESQESSVRRTLDFDTDDEDIEYELSSDEEEESIPDPGRTARYEACCRGFEIVETAMEGDRVMTEWEYIEISNIFKAMCR
jgi:hypothetical protein